MTFFDKLKQAAGQLADGASRQAEVLKLQSQLGHVQTELDRNYGEAGKRCRELYRSKRILDSEIEVIMKRVDALEGEMEALRQRVQDVQAAEEYGQEAQPQPAPTPVQQPTPPAGSVPSVAGAPAAPAAQPEPYRAPTHSQQEDKVLCPSCGKMVPSNASFCEGCGEKLSSDGE